MTRVTSHVDLSGPFFTKDPRKTVRGNIRDMLEDLAQAVEGQIRSDFRAGEAGRAPVRVIGEDARVSQHIVGRVESLTGKRWQLHAVISPSTKGLDRRKAIALMAAASRVERRLRTFRANARATRAAKADLAKGLE